MYIFNLGRYMNATPRKIIYFSVMGRADLAFWAAFSADSSAAFLSLDCLTFWRYVKRRMKSSSTLYKCGWLADLCARLGGVVFFSSFSLPFLCHHQESLNQEPLQYLRANSFE